MTDVARRFAGVHCPLVTPFDGGAVDHEALETLVDHVVDGGVDGLVPCGTTGEFASLDDAEFRAVLSTTVERADGTPVMAGTAATSVKATVDRIDAAAEAGADAALITLPYFHGANDPAGDVAFVEAVADDAALPLYLYNIPACVGRSLDADAVVELSGRDAVLGLKDSSGDLNYFSELLRRTPEGFQLFEGFDSHLVPGLVLGATGGVNALSNVVPEAFVAAATAADRGDVAEARRIHERHIAPLFQQCVEHGFAPATKAALRARGVLETDEVRPPLVGVDEAARDEISSLVEPTVAAYR
ncbi:MULTISPECIES: dihydrodipicolinate synthase family protein [Haloferax]|uniref:4-hydroxy-tetrahydrodipicolinate synthase n=1 Tax=Haloferax massiliensis TaxID=1476858 RepID=A0A0D6JU84_9EURY|nr:MULTISPECIES: dihydrodipicolinate synthase family protein [Haloferax]MDS0241448.1 dihydrodipicolinate synthase family protein [Haloferax sp. S2CR25]MDS0444569.1 dihydrodipicolinate synthase family protein [Haloferax sp. S2CR25-2]CQR52080.1 4-hydroxy-tetrahydrodipicolinate synthase [Haloferax massiliensis]